MGKRTSPGVVVQVYNQSQCLGTEFRDLKKEIIVAVGYALQQLRGETKKKNFWFTVIFVDDQQIQELNQRYRNVNLPTDVLAFPYSQSEADIFISVERALAQAKEYQQSLNQEITRLVLHGVLHCLGYRDKNKKERKKMWQIQEKILKDFFKYKNC